MRAVRNVRGNASETRNGFVSNGGTAKMAGKTTRPSQCGISTGETGRVSRFMASAFQLRAQLAGFDGSSFRVKQTFGAARLAGGIRGSDSRALHGNCGEEAGLPGEAGGKEAAGFGGVDFS